MLELGSHFPEFSLPDQNDEIRTLADYAGRHTIFFFYPKDLTSGCTTEACEFNELLPSFTNANIVGISPDPTKLHTKFIHKHHLEYPLLSDANKELLTELGIWIEKSMYGKIYMGVERTTVLIDPNGIVLIVWNKVKPAGHAAAVQQHLTNLLESQ